MRALARDGGGLSALALVFSAMAVAWPFTVARFLPFVDYPQHLGTIAAIHGAGSPTFDPYFTVELGRSQYLLYYLVADLLAYPFGVELGTRITTILSVASLPIAVACFLHAHGRPAIAGALSGLIAIHVWVFWGFINYSMGISLALFALAALAHLVRRPNARATIAYAVLACACFYAHALAYAWLAVASLLQVVAMGLGDAGPRRAFHATWRAALAAIPSVAGVLYWLMRSGFLAHGETGARNASPEDVAGEGMRFSSVPDLVARWLEHSFGFYQDGTGSRLAVLFLFVALTLIALRGAGAKLSDPWVRPAEGAWSLAPEVVLLSAVVGWLFGPEEYKLVAPINARFLPLVLALVPVLGPTRPLRQGVRVLVGALLIFASVQAAHVHARRFEEASEEMGELDAALAETEPGKKLLGLIYDPRSAVVPLPLFLHAHQYYQADVGGLAAFSFIEFRKSPVQYREGAAPEPFPPRFEWTPQTFRWSTWGEYFDYFLIRTSPGERAPTLTNDARLETLYEGPRWKLLRRAR